MSNPWGLPSSYLQDTGSLATIYSKVAAIQQSREATPPSVAPLPDNPGLYDLPSQIFKNRILQILKVVQEYSQIKRTLSQKQTWSKFSDFVNEGPISNLISIIDQMGLYYEKFVEHRKDVIELLSRESIDLHSSVLLPFSLHEDLKEMLRSFGKESEEGFDSKLKKLEKITSLNPGVKTDLVCVLQSVEEIREKVRVYAEMAMARDQKFEAIFEKKREIEGIQQNARRKINK